MTKSSAVLLVAIVLMVAIGAAVWWYNSNGTSNPYGTSASSTSDNSNGLGVTVTSSLGVGAGAQTGTQTTENFTVNANDATADLMTVTVHKGEVVNITFNVESGGTYHGGLDFRSSVVNSGTIAPGSSKTVSFTADHSFSFTPYWPSSNIKKNYTISVVVQ